LDVKKTRKRTEWHSSECSFHVIFSYQRNEENKMSKNGGLFAHHGVELSLAPGVQDELQQIIDGNHR